MMQSDSAPLFKVVFSPPAADSLREDGLRAAAESRVSQVAGLAHAAEQRCGALTGIAVRDHRTQGTTSV
jgi:hypothetical protein